MRQLTIYRRYFYNAKCYKQGTKQKSRGIQVHSTGANNPWLHRYVQPDDGRIGVNQYGNSHNNPNGDVCASAYIGKQSDGTVAVYQTLPWDMRCWLSANGPNGNANRLGYVGFEICEDNCKNADYFNEAVMNQAVMLTAHLCYNFGVTPTTINERYAQGDLLAVMDHKELHDRGVASNHGDIYDWLRRYGKTMDDFRAAVQQVMDEGLEVHYIDCDEVTGMYEAIATNPGEWLNLRQGPSTGTAVLAKIPRGSTVTVLNDANATWWQVRYGEKTGYTMAQYLTPANKPVQDSENQAQLPATDAGRPLDRVQLEALRGPLKALLEAIDKCLEVSAE